MTTPTDALANLRDLADAAPGLVAGVAYRSDAPQAGDRRPSAVEAWPPATVVDLRGAAEKAAEHPLARDAAIVNIDILSAADLTGEAAKALTSLAELYAVMIAPGTAAGVTRVVAEVARDDGPVLFHCTAGKDRTGVSAALILRLLGVDRDLVVADYHATADHMPGVVGRMFSGMPGAIGDTPLAQIPREVLEAPESAIETVLDAWDAHHDGTEGWYLDNGGDRDVLVDLRARLLA